MRQENKMKCGSKKGEEEEKVGGATVASDRSLNVTCERSKRQTLAKRRN